MLSQDIQVCGCCTRPIDCEGGQLWPVPQRHATSWLVCCSSREPWRRRRVSCPTRKPWLAALEEQQQQRRQQQPAPRDPLVRLRVRAGGLQKPAAALSSWRRKMPITDGWCACNRLPSRCSRHLQRPAAAGSAAVHHALALAGRGPPAAERRGVGALPLPGARMGGRVGARSHATLPSAASRPSPSPLLACPPFIFHSCLVPHPPAGHLGEAAQAGAGLPRGGCRRRRQCCRRRWGASAPHPVWPLHRG